MFVNGNTAMDFPSGIGTEARAVTGEGFVSATDLTAGAASFAPGRITRKPMSATTTKPEAATAKSSERDIGAGATATDGGAAHVFARQPPADGGGSEPDLTYGHNHYRVRGA